MSDSVSEAITVQADPDMVMDVIADFETYPQWQDEIKAVEVLETDDDGWGTKVRFTVDAKIFTTTYVLAYTYSDDAGMAAGEGSGGGRSYAMTWELVEGDQVRKVDGSYRLQEQDDGSTLVTYDLDVEPTISLPGMVKRKAARRIVDSALKGMKRRVEGQA